MGSALFLRTGTVAAAMASSSPCAATPSSAAAPACWPTSRSSRRTLAASAAREAATVSPRHISFRSRPWLKARALLPLKHVGARNATAFFSKTLKAAAEDTGGYSSPDDDLDYDPDDIAVSDEPVPDDVLETITAAAAATTAAAAASLTPTTPGPLPPPYDTLAQAAAELAEAEAAEGGSLSKDEEERVRRDLKVALLDSLYGTERGFRAGSETRAEIAELIAQLEAVNPTPAPTENSPLLGGKWVLLYTSFSELLPLLAASNIPLVRVGDITQTVDADAATILNAVTFVGPLTSSTIEVSATFEVRSPKRLQVKFQEGIIGAPQVVDASGGSSPLSIPTSLELFGQKLDLSPLSSALEPVRQAGLSVARLLSGQPPLKFQIAEGGVGVDAQSWLLTTYLDSDLRISRGDGGGLFVLIREGSPLQE